MNNPLVSVIIPVYNGERYFAAALDSAFAQDYRPIEVIVVNDGSEDGTANIAREYREIRYFHQLNQGVSVARNVALAAARGEFIAFLDADDIWAPTKLSLQVGFLLDNPQIGYVVANQQILLEPGVRLPPWFQKRFLDGAHTTYVPSALIARRSVFDQVGGFDPTLRSAEDTEWLCRAKDAGIMARVLPETLLFRRFHGRNLSLSGRPEAGHSLRLRILKASVDRQRQRKSSVGPV